MKKSRFTEQQIAFTLRQVEPGTSLHTALVTVGAVIALLGLGGLGVASLADLDARTVLLVAFALSFSSAVFAVPGFAKRP